MKKFSIVVAVDKNWGIGLDGNIPWVIEDDMRRFKSITMNAPSGMINVVIMGRVTYFSIPEKYRPLSGRINIVISSANGNLNNGVIIVKSLDHALHKLAAPEFVNNINDIFVVGGVRLYNEAMQHPLCDTIYLTYIHHDYNCDRVINAITDDWKLQSNYQRIQYAIKNLAMVFYDFRVYNRIKQHNADEVYIKRVKYIIKYGKERIDRTNVGTLSIFGIQMRFNLNNSFPLLTTKKLFWRGIVEELLWFIRGETNTKSLVERGVHIWDANATREFLDNRGLDYEEGELGPIYGFQWRNWGANYPNTDTKSVDQLRECINQIKNNPTSRRIIMTAWNPSQIHQMALPPCHVMVQFYVNDNCLDSQLYQRSGDMGLGVPFNIASYALLTVMIAHVCGLKPGEFIHTIGDAHIYKSHIEALNIQCYRKPYAAPKIKIINPRDDIDQFQFGDFELINYKYHPNIKMDMAI